MVQVPQLRIGKFMDFIKSREFIAVAAAVILTPLALRGVGTFVEQSDLLRRNFTVALIIAGFVLFLVAGMVSGFLRAIFLGIAAGVAITAVAPFFEGNLNRVFGGK